MQVWLDAASSALGLLKMTHLKKALEVARVAGLPDLVERSAAALQRIREEDLGLKSVSSSMKISDEQMSELLAPVLSAGTWQNALLACVYSYGPIAGDVDQNKARAIELARDFPLSQMFPRELLGSDGLPRFSPRNEADMEEMRIASVEGFSLQVYAPVLAIAIGKIADTYGIPSQEDLDDFFGQSPLVDTSLARSISGALYRFWLRDSEAATYVLTPKIEALARGLVLALDAGVYRLQREEKPGQYPGLGSLLGVLREHGLDESWCRSIAAICCNPTGGWNFRNELSHGFVNAPGPAHFAAVFQCAMYLWSMWPEERSEDA